MTTVDIHPDSIFVRVELPRSVQDRNAAHDTSSITLSPEESAKVFSSLQATLDKGTEAKHCKTRVCETVETDDGRKITFCWYEWGC